jgi:hypothetical protein
VFPGGSTLFAAAGIACNGSGCKGGILLNDTASTNLDIADRETLIAVLAHEMGHALGLGHSSSKTALMYYAQGGKSQTNLTQDDIDGISYLYPTEKKLGGLGGACGSVDLDSKGGGPGNFFGSLLFGLIIVIILKFKNVKLLF